MRDIARAAEMLPGSLYYHFSAKEDLLVAVYEEGVRRISQGARSASRARTEPWGRLEAAAIAHLEALLGGSDYAQVVIRIMPKDVPKVASRLIRLRDGYERLFDDLIAALPLARRTDRRMLRLMLLGALNWSQGWFRIDGDATPRSVARSFLKLLRDPQFMKQEVR